MTLGTAVEPALAVSGLTKTFGGSRALADFSVEIAPGEIHALVGENGSGKSTFVKLLSGLYTPDSGATITVGGQPLQAGDPAASHDAGLRFVHQDLGLIAELDSAENLALGVGYGTKLGRPIRWRKQYRAAQIALGALGYDIDVRLPLSKLTPSERTAIAIARATAVKPGSDQPRLLVLDEPTVNLPGPEADRLFELMYKLRDAGLAIIFISHHFDEIFRVASKVTVLRDGRRIATEPIENLTHTGLVEMMLGRSVEELELDFVDSVGDPVLSIDDLAGGSVSDFTMTLRAGEVVGIAGITGSGREDVARLVSGDADHQGRIAVNTSALPSGDPHAAISAGVVAVHANRQASSTIPQHTIRENLTIAGLGQYLRAGRINTRAEKADVARLMEVFDIRPRQSEKEIGLLSGGNQQKVMIARALRLKPTVLVLDEPTQGVDVGAQAAIHRLIVDAANDGMAVLVCSSVSEELATLCDRVLVMNGGSVSAELHRPLNPDQITASTLNRQKTKTK
ncbi:sugar ABC transporter ATP-binding protein [Subtercola endophyticus]|uniref:sugar ABC transporter ATP-binding protein n=1 Tax=Subtercola endophyticus TaxID=2895559 RepID=UPI001E433B03|nr:sugar ABC transporter ATP-binding protein [Subtercola endophyticus]UFS58328.1 sugar ABC transporter ATP-binding protein [Subtercola endophyticus]